MKARIELLDRPLTIKDKRGHTAHLPSLVLHGRRLDVRVDLSCLGHRVAETEKLKWPRQRPNMSLLWMRLEPAQPHPLRNRSQNLFRPFKRRQQNPEIIHVSDVVPAMQALLDVMIKLVERGNAGNLDHLRSWTISVTGSPFLFPFCEILRPKD